MSQNLVSNLTLRIEQEKQVMQEHQEKIGLFRRTQKLAEQLEKRFTELAGGRSKIQRRTLPIS